MATMYLIGDRLEIFTPAREPVKFDIQDAAQILLASRTAAEPTSVEVDAKLDQQWARLRESRDAIFRLGLQWLGSSDADLRLVSLALMVVSAEIMKRTGSVEPA